MSSIAALVAPGIATLSPYEPGKPIEEVERELGPVLPAGGVIKLASNENPLGPSPRALDALRAALSEIHRYPDGGGYHLRRALAAAHARHAVREEEVAIGNGSNEILDLLVRTFCGPGDEVIAPAQTFVCYKLSAQARGVAYRDVPRGPGFAYDLDALASAAGARTKIVFLANPDNPTGVYATAAEVRRLMDRLPGHVILAVDEAYHEYAEAADYPDMLALRGERLLTVTMRTFSKIYGLAGLRCGWGVGPAELIEYLNRVRAPFNVSALAQAAAVAALGDGEHVARSRQANREGMMDLTDGLGRLGVGYVPSQGNFVLFDVAPREGRQVFVDLLARGVIVRPMGGYGLPQHLRVTVGTRAENHRFLGALSVVLGLG
ncbi:MAG: histidinol-phosphate transaminase [Myxococcales bacterium]|nr:histidinol-phosphate transaminase [Myxococcales bacterium]